MRILGLDYGTKRIGVAVCDELGMTAQALGVIERKNKQKDLEVLERYIRSFGVEKIVIGYPLRLDGSAGIQCEKVDRFIHHLERAFSLPLVRWDETLTTSEAEAVLRGAQVPIPKRKALVDKVAAALILQAYLDR